MSPDGQHTNIYLCLVSFNLCLSPLLLSKVRQDEHDSEEIHVTFG